MSGTITKPLKFTTIVTEMPVNKVEALDLEHASTLSSTASRIGKKLGRKYSTSTDDEKVYITRLK